MTFSIGIILPKPIFNELSKIVNDLAFGYKGPVFVPHMTVVGNIDGDLAKIQKAIEKVVINTEDLKLSLGSISFSTTYFQSVFVRINSTAQLMQLNLEIKKSLGLENNIFMPHISLIYGNHDMTTREKIAKEIKLKKFKFVANKLVIIQEKPEPSEWELVATIPFGRSSK